jgi:Effector-associated domain 11
MSTPYLSEIRHLLEKDNIPAAIAQLKRLLDGTPLLSAVLAQSGRHNAMLRQLIAGTATIADTTQTKDEIRQALLALVDEIERQSQRPDIAEELKEVIVVLHAFERRAHQLRLLSRIGLGLLLLVALTATWLYALRDRIWPGSFLLTVLVHGEKGIDDRILRDQGEVYLDIGMGRFSAKIDGRGEATFKEIPSLYLGRSARLTIDHPQPYKALHPDSTYQLDGKQAIYLACTLGNLDSVFGFVRDFATGQPLAGARVSSRNIATHSDVHGWFSLHFPPDARRKFMRLSAEKAGYAPWHLDSVAPHIQQEQIIHLHPSNYRLP